MGKQTARESDGLDVIVIDDDRTVCRMLEKTLREFYVWGDVIAFTDPDEATRYCLARESGLAIFIVDVFLGDKTGFAFLDGIGHKYHSAHEDAVMITGSADADVVNTCVASEICHLLEKPVRPYALQFAVRAIVTKYQKFAKRLLRDPSLAAFTADFR